MSGYTAEALPASLCATANQDVVTIVVWDDTLRTSLQVEEGFSINQQALQMRSHSKKILQDANVLLQTDAQQRHHTGRSCCQAMAVGSNIPLT